MNNFQNFHSTSQHQNGRRVQCQSFSLPNSHTLKRTRSELRISYLRKLLSENLRVNEKSSNFFQRKRIKENQSGMRIFDKSNLVLHSNKFIQKYYARDNHSSLHLGKEKSEKKEDIISRYKKISEHDNTLPMKGKKNSKSQKYRLNKCFQLSKVNKIELNKEKKKQNIQDKQIYELRKIGRLLEEIKFEIYKNRSMIIEGINQTKKIKKEKTQLPQLSLNDSRVSSGQDNIKNQRALLIKSFHLNMNSQGPKPTIQYKRFNKIR